MRDDQCVVYLTPTQVRQMEALIDTLGVSRTLLLNMAARFGLSRMGPSETRGWPRRFGPEAISVDLTGETLLRLPPDIEVGPLIVFGLKGLHARLKPL